MKLIDTFLKSRTAANVVMIGIICLGLIALTQIRRETFPSSELDMLRVVAEYKGASPEEVENSVLRLIEERCTGVRGFKSVEGSATEGRAVVNVALIEGTDTLAALMELRDQVSQITGFPPGVEDIVVTEVKRKDRVQTLVIYGDVPEKVLKAYGEKLRDELLTRRIATEVAVEAARKPEIHIMVPEAKLREYGLTMDDVARRVAQSNINAPIGEISTAGGKFLLRIKDEKRKPGEFMEIPVAVSPGKSEVILGAIARVERTWEEVEVGARYDGKPAIIIQIDKNDRQDTLSVAKAVGRHLAEYREKLPEQIRVEVFRDQSERIGQRLGILVENGIMGLILVFFVLWFFTSSRVAFWVTWGIPVSFLGTIFAMWIVGHTLNMITMFGLLMVIGMLVDDAVVIAENIFAHRQRGESIFDASSRGATEVFWPVIASSLTTIGAFIPLMFVGGRMGRTMGALPWVVVAALILSAIEAFLSMPRHLKHAVEALPRNRDSGNGVRARINRIIKVVSEKWMGRLSEIILKHRYWVLGASLAVLLATAGMLVGGRILFTFFPTPDTNSIIARVRFPVGTPAAVTEAQVSELESALKKVESKLGATGDKDKRLIQRVLVRFGETTVHSVRGGHLAQVEVELQDAEIRDVTSNKVISAWRKHTIRTPGVSTLTFGRAERGIGGRELDMRLVGRSWQELNAAAKEVTKVLATTRGISNVDIGLRPGKAELRLRVNEQGRMLGLTAGSLAEQVRNAFQGRRVGESQGLGGAYAPRPGALHCHNC
jgi:multidrug efflux pump subunit AcrB